MYDVGIGSNTKTKSEKIVLKNFKSFFTIGPLTLEVERRDREWQQYMRHPLQTTLTFMHRHTPKILQ